MDEKKYFPVKNKEVIVREIEQEKFIFDTVSGTIAKTNDFVLQVLRECNGRSPVDQIFEKLKLNDLGYSHKDLHDFLRALELHKFIHMVERNDLKNIILINPPFPHCHARYNTQYYTPPLGLLQIAAQLEKRGYIVKIIDMAVLDLKPYHIIEYIRKMNINPYIIGISCNMTFTAAGSLRIADIIKDVFPFTEIILGGNHATFCYEEILKSEKSIDYINLYEGEIVFPNLCDFLIHGGDIECCKGIAYKNERGQIIKTEPQDRVGNLNDLEFPAYHLINMDLYNEVMKGIVMTSRGCPHKCIYCSTAKFNGNVYYYSVDKVIENIKRLVNEYHLKHITFGDDAFTINKARTLQLCERLKQEQFGISWSCNTRVDMVDEEIFTSLKEAGCTDILFGIESTSNQVLDRVSKRFHFEDVRKSVNIAKKVGIRIKQNFIIGLPFETQETLEDMRSFIKETNPEVVEFCILCLFPGTDLYVSAKEYGITNFKVPWEELQLIKPGLETNWLTQEQLLDNYIKSWNLIDGR